MQISSRFTIAIHILVCIAEFEKEHKITSEFLSLSINTNPVIIRKILQQLKTPGLISIQRGSGGASIAKPLDEITLYHIYQAVECVGNGELFHFHENPNPNCPVGKNIHSVLEGRLNEVQNVMENELKKITVAEILKDTESKFQENS